MKPRHQQLLAAIRDLTDACGYRPTMRELSAAMGLSLGRVHQLVAACEREGLIARKPGIARTYRAAREETSHA